VCQPEGGCDAEPDPCAGVRCREGSVCVDGECVERDDRELSDWGDNGSQLPLCEDGGDCTEEEDCRPAFGRQRICAAECEDLADCPAEFFCCETDLIEGGPVCVHEGNQIAGALCR